MEYDDTRARTTVQRPCGRAAARHGAVRAVATAAFVAAAAVFAAAAPASASEAAAPPSAERQRELMRLLRQECGSCHGLALTGGLGPALTRDALADKPVDSMAATIFAGRPGTPMPPWQRFLSAAEAHWLATQLAQGLPAENRSAAR